MRMFTLAFSLFCFHTFCQVAELSASPGLGRDDAVAFQIGTNGYVVTGNHNGFSESNRLWRFNSIENSWDEAATFPGIPRQYACAFAIGNSGYLIGGISEDGTPLHDVWEYKATTDQWSSLENFPGVARWGASACSYGSCGFLVGGTDGASTTNSCWRFDGNTQTWDSLPPFPGIGTREGILLALNDKLIYTGGFSINPVVCWQKSYVYTISTNNWVLGADFPISQSAYLSGSGMFDSGMVCSGWNADNSFSNTLWKTNGSSWELYDTLPFTGIRGMSSFGMDGEVYFTTGVDPNATKNNRLFRVGTKISSDAIQIFPNPSTEKTTIYAPIGASIQVFDCMGKTVLATISNNTLFNLELEPGAYLIAILYQGQQHTRKLLVI